MSYMTYEEFLESCRCFKRVSDKIDDSWIIVDDLPCEMESAYLTKKMYKTLSFTTVSNEEDSGYEDVQLTEDINDQSEFIPDIDEDPSEFTPAQTCHEEKSVCFEYDVLYSRAQGVPVLYFRAHHTATGRTLALQEVWGCLEGCHSGAVLADRWGALSLEEHPVRGVPACVLHPCKTAHLLGCVGVRVGGEEGCGRGRG